MTDSQLPTAQSLSPRTITGGSTMREVERRQASSTIIKEEYLGQLPQEGEVRYVEVPIIEEVVHRVPKKEIVEVPKIVPRVQIDYVDRYVEVPVIHYVDRVVEVPEVREVVRQVKKHEVREVPREVVRTVPRYEYVEVTKVVEVPGQIIEVAKPVIHEKIVPVPRYVDNEVPLVVAQTIRPIISEGHETVEVEVFEYEPQVVVVDVHVPKPVPTQLVAAGLVEEMHRVVTVPAAQYNSMLKTLNRHIDEAEQRNALPFVIETNGVIPFLSDHESHLMYPAPLPTAQIQGYVQGAGIRHVERFTTSTATATATTGAFRNTPSFMSQYNPGMTMIGRTIQGPTTTTVANPSVVSQVSSRQQYGTTAARTYSVPPTRTSHAQGSVVSGPTFQPRPTQAY